MPMLDPANRPLLLVAERLLRIVLSWAVVKSVGPPTFRARVAPLLTVMLAAVQLPELPLYSDAD